MDQRRAAYSVRWYYFFRFMAMGSMFPYLGPYFKEYCGATDRDIGLFSMAGAVVALFTDGVWSVLADKASSRARFTAGLCLMSAFVVPMLAFVRDFWSVLAVLLLHALFFSPITPMANSVALEQLGTRGRAGFGTIRVWGTVGFLVSLWLIGPQLDAAGLLWMFPVFSLGTLVAAGFMWRIPARDRRAASGVLAAAVRALCRKRNVLGFLLAAFFASLGSHMGYVFFSIYARELGANNTLLGRLWSIGVGAEIAMMLFAARLVSRIGVKRLILVGMLGVFAKWAGMSLASTWWHLLPFQLFHAASFGAFYIGAVSFMDAESPENVRSTAQAVYNILSVTLCRIIAGPLSGEIAGHIGYSGLMRLCGLMGLVGFVLTAVLVREPVRPEGGRNDDGGSDADRVGRGAAVESRDRG
ncbi:MAG: MFS transporter [Kiritimatiellae bacterium]|nr:MFS transporter [Kiritimatiellia bacterium]